MAVLKPLYFGSDLSDLQKAAKLGDTSKWNAKALCMSGEKIFKEAVIQKNLGEEKAYVFFHKYIECVQKINKNPEFKKDAKYFTSMYNIQKNSKRAAAALEALTTSLETRYDEKNKVKNTAEGFAQLDISNIAINNGIHKDEPKEYQITHQKLYSLINQKSTTFFILDTRPAADYHNSSMTIPNSLSVPEMCLRPGTTASSIGKNLKIEFKGQWDRRTTVDMLILCDWTSSDFLPDKPVTVLRDAIIKWDLGSEYKNPPYLLQGGFQKFLYAYPLNVTNPKARAPLEPRTAGKPIMPSLDFDTGQIRSASLGEKSDLEKAINLELCHFDKHKEHVEQIIVSKSTEMKNLILAAEKYEKENKRKMQEIHQADQDLVDLERRLAAIRKIKMDLKNECQQNESRVVELNDKIHKLEGCMDKELEIAQVEGSNIETRIQDLKRKLSEIDKVIDNGNAPSKVLTDPTPQPEETTKSWIDFIDKEIDEKERDLECPVCLEVAASPIYMCAESHLICRNCRPKLKNCPECRMKYGAKPKIHRYAEKTAEELARLKNQRMKILEPAWKSIEPLGVETAKTVEDIIPKNEINSIFGFLDTLSPSPLTPPVIRTLVSRVTRHCIDGINTNCVLNEPKFREFGVPILKKYLDAVKTSELAALFSLQALVNSLEHPNMLLHSIFDVLYDCDVISEDAFLEWEESTEPGEQEGKGVALKSCKQFFYWLNGEEE